MSGMVRQQAMVMSIGDVFYALTFLFLALVFITPLMQRPKAAPPPGEAH